jgi:NAD(P)-dependent dehydrogenase (short-subunit alcohol dehydrogenase family)
MTSRFEGKVAIVTGAAHGLGASHALTFAREGAIVAPDPFERGLHPRLRIAAATCRA